MNTLNSKQVEKLSRTKGTTQINVRGLYLERRLIKSGLGAYWVFRSTFQGKPIRVQIGRYDFYSNDQGFSLNDAELIAHQFHKEIAAGINPQERKQEELKQKKQELKKSFTFGEIFNEWIIQGIQTQKNPNVVFKLWKGRFNNYLFFIKDLNIAEITYKTLFNEVILKTSLKESGHMVLRDSIFSLFSKVFIYAQSKDYISDTIQDPAKHPLLKNLIKGLNLDDTQKNFGYLPPEEIKEFISMLLEYIKERRSKNSLALSQIALLFAILTSSRVGNVLTGTKHNNNFNSLLWNRIDYEQGIIEIPAEEMKISKNGKHQIVLSDIAIELLTLIPHFDDENIIFHSRKNKGFDKTTFIGIIKDINRRRKKRGLSPFIDKEQSTETKIVNITQHGLSRATFTTWAGSTSFFYDNGKPIGEKPIHIATELILHHVPTNNQVQQAYLRANGKLIEERRIIANEWAKFLLDGKQLKDYIIPLKLR